MSLYRQAGFPETRVVWALSVSVPPDYVDTPWQYVVAVLLYRECDDIVYVQQVVAGTLVRLTLELGYTSCRKGEDGDISNCQLKEDSVMTISLCL
jgi:hypothetical protein